MEPLKILEIFLNKITWKTCYNSKEKINKKPHMQYNSSFLNFDNTY